MSDAVRQIGQDIAEGYEDVARGIARMTSHLGADASSAVAASANALVAAATDFADRVKSESGAVSKRVREEVREHPIATATIAAALAGVLGYAAAHARHRRRAKGCQCGKTTT